MDFQLTAEQEERISHVRRFSEEVLANGAMERIQDGRFDRGLWEQAAEFGLTGLPIPEQYGGSGLGALDTMLTVEAMGRGCIDLGFLFSLSAHMFACAVPVWRHGDDAIRSEYLEGMATGRLIGANVITEPGSGSDAYAMRTTARRDGDDYVLDGEKCFITNAPAADVYVAYAKTNPKQAFFGVSCFVIPRDTRGLVILPDDRKNSLATSPWSGVRFEDCRVPARMRVGEEGAGGAIFHDSMIWERGCLFAAYVGAMERVLEDSTSHARDRQQFGRPIARNQSVSNKLVDMKLRLETSRLLLYRAGWLYDAGKPFEEAIAQSKLWISESAVQTGLDAIQIAGGMGVSREAGVDRLLLDSLPSRIFSGTSEIQREFIAQHMGLR